MRTASPVVLVTGSSSGFGRAMVTAFLASGARVVAGMRRAEERTALFREDLERWPGQLELVTLDVTRPEDRRAVVARVEERYQRLDGLVNNAGYGLFGALEDLSEAQLRDEFEVNFFAVALLTRAFLPVLRRSKGRVINISSVFGYHGFPLTSAYCASKFALEGLTESLSYELRPHGVQVALVQPGGHRTRFGDSAQWGEPSTAEAPYALQHANYRALRQRLAERRAIPPEKVARVVVHLFHQERMPLRRRVGKDAKLVHLLQTLLPTSWAWRLFDRIYTRVFLRNPPAAREG